MAFHKTLAHRFLHLAKACSSHLRPAITRKLLPESDSGLTRRFLHKNSIPPDRFPLPTPSGDNLIERIRMINGPRIRFDCLIPPQIPKEEDERRENGMSMTEVRKVLKAAQMELARSRFRSMEKDVISYAEFMNVCSEISRFDQGLEIAKALDESGAVIVLGNVVFLRPDQVAKAVESIIPMPIPQKNPVSLPHQNDCRNEELQELEEKKAKIDKLAEDGVRKELWGGLGFMVVQTIGLMRLTFWELSWDVMEPICFYLTSMYFLAGYSFFLKTSKEPSFEGFFQSRFEAKQKQLMRAYNFDLSRFNELKKGCRAPASFPSEGFASSNCDCRRRHMQIGTVH